MVIKIDIELAVLRARKLLHAIRARQIGLAVSGTAASVEHRHLGRLSVDHILDVGANRGQFALMARNLFPEARIECFEPIPACVERLQALDSGLELSVNAVALSSVSGTAVFNLSKSMDSSSLLQIGRRQADCFPGTEHAARIEVRTECLDSWIVGRELGHEILLKIDVQGAELMVLEGGVSALKATRFVYIELSFVELYDKQPLISDVVRFLADHRFALLSVHNVHYSRTGEAIQADVLFEQQMR